MTNTTETKPNDDPRHKPSLLEWLMAALGLIIVVGMLGFVLAQALEGSTSPPDVTVRVQDVVQTSNGYLAQVVAENAGDETAAALTLEGELKRGDEVIETSTLTLDYLPGRARRNAGLFFRNDPREYTLEVRAKGHEKP